MSFDDRAAILLRGRRPCSVARGGQRSTRPRSAGQVPSPVYQGRESTPALRADRLLAVQRPTFPPGGLLEEQPLVRPGHVETGWSTGPLEGFRPGHHAVQLHLDRAGKPAPPAACPCSANVVVWKPSPDPAAFAAPRHPLRLLRGGRAAPGGVIKPGHRGTAQAVSAGGAAPSRPWGGNPLQPGLPARRFQHLWRDGRREPIFRLPGLTRALVRGRPGRQRNFRVGAPLRRPPRLLATATGPGARSSTQGQKCSRGLPAYPAALPLGTAMRDDFPGPGGIADHGRRSAADLFGCSWGAVIDDRAFFRPSNSGALGSGPGGRATGADPSPAAARTAPRATSVQAHRAGVHRPRGRRCSPPSTSGPILAVQRLTTTPGYFRGARPQAADRWGGRTR